MNATKEDGLIYHLCIHVYAFVHLKILQSVRVAVYQFQNAKFNEWMLQNSFCWLFDFVLR